MIRAFVTATLLSAGVLAVFIAAAVLVPVVFEGLLYPGMLVVSALDNVWPALGADRVNAIVTATSLELLVVWGIAFAVTLARRARNP